jgi:hypothetical protein
MTASAVPSPASPTSPLAQVAGRARPISLAGEQLLPVPAPLAKLLPGGGLRRGSVVAVSPGSPSGASGATSLALALISAISHAGSWCAGVGLPDLGPAAGAELGIALERFALVPNPAEQWAIVTAALIEAVDAILVRPARPVRLAEARRLRARAQESGAVLVPCGDSWPERADLQMAVVRSRWQGLGQGHGFLRTRMVEVVASGRGAASRQRRIQLWLPGPDGAVAEYDGGDRQAAAHGPTDQVADRLAVG